MIQLGLVEFEFHLEEFELDLRLVGLLLLDSNLLFELLDRNLLFELLDWKLLFELLDSNLLFELLVLLLYY